MTREILAAILKTVAKNIERLPLRYREREEIDGYLRRIEGVIDSCWHRIKLEHPEVREMGLYPFMESELCKQLGQE